MNGCYIRAGYTDNIYYLKCKVTKRSSILDEDKYWHR